MVVDDLADEERTVSSEKHLRLEWYAGAIFFCSFIGAHLMFGAKAAVRVAGVACVATGILWMVRRSIPVGIEGRAPSAYVAGWPAVLAGLAIGAVGVGLLIYSALAACLLGWAPVGEC
jgi:hypothetical protein